LLAADLSQIEFAILYYAFWCLAYAVFDLDRNDAAIYVTMGIQPRPPAPGLREVTNRQVSLSRKISFSPAQRPQFGSRPRFLDSSGKFRPHGRFQQRHPSEIVQQGGHEESPVDGHLRLVRRRIQQLTHVKNPCLTLASVGRSWKGRCNKFTTAKLLSTPLLAQKAEAS
jgi:hypothetical protein